MKLLKTKKNAAFIPSNRINFLIVNKLDAWLRDFNFHFTLKDCLFGGVKLAKDTDRDKFAHSGYGIGFDSQRE